MGDFKGKKKERLKYKQGTCRRTLEKKHNGKSVDKTTFGRLYCAVCLIFISFLRYNRDIKTACADVSYFFEQLGGLFDVPF